MNSSKSSPEQIERALIVSGNAKRPYGVKLIFEVQTKESISSLENMTLLLDEGTIAHVTPEEQAPWEGGKRYKIELAGFPRASAAETSGKHLTQTMLLLAVSLDFGLRLNYSTHDPAVVFERFKSDGLTLRGYGTSYWPQERMLESLSNALTCSKLSEPVVLSMELFCAGVLEGNSRARFVSVVSALEPLAAQQSLGIDVEEFIVASKEQLSAMPGISEKLKQSLSGRLNELRRESVRQSLQRLCGEWFPESPEIWAAIDHAYRLRSQLVHAGALADPDTDLNEEIGKISMIIRAIYQKASGLDFLAKPTLPT